MENNLTTRTTTANLLTKIKIPHTLNMTCRLFLQVFHPKEYTRTPCIFRRSCHQVWIVAKCLGIARQCLTGGTKVIIPRQLDSATAEEYFRGGDISLLVAH